MGAEEDRWIHVGEVDDFPEGEKVEKVVHKERLLILREKDKWHAFEALCPHMSRLLDNARLKGKELECIWHNIRFHIETGEILDSSGFIDIPDLKVYEIKIEEGRVYVKSDSDPIYGR
jgi:nitrite reductase/ring-hydroxylating ferredoxin subunit